MPAEREGFMKKIKKFFKNLAIRFLNLPVKAQIMIIAIVIIFIIVALSVGAAIQEKNTEKDTTYSTEISEEKSSESEEENASSDETDDTDEDIVVSYVNIFFNGTELTCYADKNVAVENAVELSSFSDSTAVPVMAVVGENDNIKRVRVWTETSSGTDNGDEYFLSSNSGWSDTLDLSEYSGTIIIAISTADYTTPPNNTYQYTAVQVDVDDTTTETETGTESEQNSTVSINDAVTESDGISNPKIFVNSVATTGYSSISEAVSNPMLIADKKFTLSAKEVNDGINNITVQFGDESGNSTEINSIQLSGDDWSETVNASSYESNILVLYLESSIGFGGNSIGQFIAVQFQE